MTQNVPSLSPVVMNVCVVEHVSLDAKHGMYGKPSFKRMDSKYHIDIFIDTDTVTLGDEVVYKDGIWVV